MPVIGDIIAASFRFMGGGATGGAGVWKDRACGVRLSGDGVLAQAGGGIGSTDAIIRIGEGAVEWHIGVVGVESVSVSILEFMSVCS